MAAAVARPVVYAGLLFTGTRGSSHSAWGWARPRLLSPLDVGGFLFLLLAYGVWFSINTRYRAVVPAALPARTD